MELKTDHNGLKTFAQQLRKARDNYTQKLTELGQGFTTSIKTTNISKIFAQGGRMCLVGSLSQKYCAEFLINIVC